MTKSKFKSNHLLWNLLMLISSLGIFYLLVSILKNLFNSKIGVAWILLAMFLLIILVGIFLSIKNIKYLKINTEENELIWYSVLNPFGKKLNLSDHLGYISTDVYSANGVTKKIYLVDEERKTVFGIDELVYSNFDELVQSLNMKELKFKKGGVSNYFKLLYWGKIKV